MAEIRVSPDGEMVAIRSGQPADSLDAWAVMHRIHGGHWCKAVEVQSWEVLVGE